MNSIPPLGWVAIAIILIILIAVNVSMFAMLRGRNQRPVKMPRIGQSAKNLDTFHEVLRDPFHKERKQLNELSDLVDHLKKDN